VAAFGAVLITVFNHSLDRSLDQITLNSELRAQIDSNRNQLAAARNPDPMVQGAIVESFISGYRSVIWIAASLALLSAVAAWLLIEPGVPTSAKRG